MLYFAYGATYPLKGVDESRVGIVFLVDLETQVGAEDITKVQHLIPIHGQTSNSCHVMQMGLIIPNSK